MAIKQKPKRQLD